MFIFYVWFNLWISACNTYELIAWWEAIPLKATLSPSHYYGNYTKSDINPIFLKMALRIIWRISPSDFLFSPSKLGVPHTLSMVCTTTISKYQSFPPKILQTYSASIRLNFFNASLTGTSSLLYRFTPSEVDVPVLDFLSTALANWKLFSTLK